MPALTHEQEMLKAAAMQFKVHGMFTSSHGRFNELANVDAILALFAQLEAPADQRKTQAETALQALVDQAQELDMGYGAPDYGASINATYLDAGRAALQQPVQAVPDGRYDELIYAVARKFPGETRHETALRYIRQAEANANAGSPAAVGAAPGEPGQ